MAHKQYTAIEALRILGSASNQCLFIAKKKYDKASKQSLKKWKQQLIDDRVISEKTQQQQETSEIISQSEE